MTEDDAMGEWDLSPVRSKGSKCRAKDGTGKAWAVRITSHHEVKKGEARDRIVLTPFTAL